MREEKTKSNEGATLWRRARQGWTPVAEAEAPDALLLAAYLDGGLAEEEAALLEARLAGEPALLDELLALRASLAAGPEQAPAGVLARARAAHPAAAAPRAVAVPSVSLVERLFGLWLRPAVPAFAAVALLLACAGAFELGRYQAVQWIPVGVDEAADSDVPVDLMMNGLL